MTQRFLDLDARFAERDAKPIVVRLFGEDWQLPASVPTAAILRVARWNAEGRNPEADLTAGEVLLLLGDMIPGEVYEAWVAKGLDIDQYGEIVKLIFAVWKEQAGEAQAPVTGQTSTSPQTPSNGWHHFSNDGGPSKPISRVTTDSTPTPSFN